MAVRGRCHFPQNFPDVCFVGLLYLFIFKVVTTERRKEREKKRSNTGVDMEEPLRRGAWRTLGRLGGGWEPCPARTLWGVLPDLLSGVGLLADPSLQTLAICQGRKPLGFPATVTQTPQASRLCPESSHEASSKRSSGSHYLPLRRVPRPGTGAWWETRLTQWDAQACAPQCRRVVTKLRPTVTPWALSYQGSPSLRLLCYKMRAVA